MKKIILILTLICSSVFAEESLYWRQLPVVCGIPENVQAYINEKEFEPVAISLGRELSQPDGEPVFMVTYYANSKKEALVTIDIPNGTETCIMFHSFNMAIVKDKPNT